MRISTMKVILGALWALLGLAVGAYQAQALPSFARQTGMSCAACHTVFPELTTYGRTFKLNGYTTNNSDSLKDGSDDAGYRLSISNTPPIAAMIQVADTFTKTPPQGEITNGSDNNGQLEFPSQFSLFYAGALTPKLGAFVQVTYDSASGAFGMDNTDIRFADRVQLGSTDLVYGLTLNNNPTVQDVFNSTPAWGFPYSGGNTAMTPATGTMIEGLGGSVGGLGLYAFWNQLVYAEVSAYRTAPQGGPAATDIQGYAPYWRVALTKDFDKHSISVGAFGMEAKTYPDAAVIVGAIGPDDVSDVAVDGQYQYVDKDIQFTVKGSCIWENQKWVYSNDPSVASTTNPTDTVTSMKGDVTFYYDRKIGFTVGYMNINGSADAGLYAALLNSVPDSSGWIAEVNFVPWYNTKFSLQYTMYDKFDGATQNYDGLGRNASDNNTLMAMAWLMI